LAEVDVSRSEFVEAELDVMIRRRHDRRVESEGERQERERWQETEIVHDQQRREANRSAWGAYHRSAAKRARATMEALIAEHLAAAERLGEESA
jgi:hypothetical protein